MEKLFLENLLPAWRLYEVLARHTDPPVPLPPRTELLALEEAHLQAPFADFLKALRAWALGRSLGDPPLPQARPLEGGSGGALGGRASAPTPSP